MTGSVAAAFAAVRYLLLWTKRYWPEVSISFVAVVTVSLVANRHWGLMITASVGTSFMLATAIRWNLVEGDLARLWRLGLLVCCTILIGLLTRYWVMTDGFVFTRDFGESFSVFLAAHNAHDFVTFLLQDMSTDVDAAGHPFIYTHQPSFVARLSSMVLQAFGLGIPGTMALNFIGATVLLWTMANALTKHLPWPVVFGGAFFAVSNYAVFHENIVDMTRAPGYFALFGGLAVVSNDPGLRKPWSRIGLATAIAAAAATDFAVCVFVVYVLVGVHVWLSKAVHAKSLLLPFVTPCAGFYAIYFGTAAAVVGLNLFVVDMLFSYLGTAGQIPPALSSLDWIPNLSDGLQAIPPFYQEAGVVLWPRSHHGFNVKDVIVSIASSWRVQASYPVALGMGVTSVASLLLTIGGYHRWRLFAPASGGLIALCIGLKFPLFVLILIPVAFLLTLPHVDIHRTIAGRLWCDRDATQRTENALVFAAIFAMGILAVASLFPTYGMRFVISERRGVPAPLLEMLSFGLLVFVGYMMMRYGGDSDGFAPRKRAIGIVLGITLLAFASGLVVRANVKLFRSSPPRAPSYAYVLSRPEYRHEPFVTTSFYGQVWYFTRGWAYMVPNPPRKPFVDYWNLRHLRDWKNIEKYGHPHYFLCDNTHLKGYSLTPPRPCLAKGRCNCEDIANYMRELGYTTVVARPDFAIIDVRNVHGLLHRPSGANLRGSAENDRD